MILRADVSNIDYSLAPEHLRIGLRNYIESGYVPGSFLQSILKGDIHAAIKVADNSSLMQLRSLIIFIEEEFPEVAYGTPEKFNNWLKTHATFKLEARKESQLNYS